MLRCSFWRANTILRVSASRWRLRPSFFSQQRPPRYKKTSMPSSLVGLKRTLVWDDFKGKVPSGDTAAAATFSGFTVSVPTYESTDGGVRLKDEITVRITFDPNQSWKQLAVAQLADSDPVKKDLLDHEQGHYNISALIARDLFIRLMTLKGTVYPDKAAGNRDYQDWQNIYGGRLTNVQGAYDNDTLGGQANVFNPNTNVFTPPVQKSNQQIRWEGFITTAFTKQRTPPVTAPDGVLYKVELIDVLLAAGVQFP